MKVNLAYMKDDYFILKKITSFQKIQKKKL